MTSNGSVTSRWWQCLVMVKSAFQLSASAMRHLIDSCIILYLLLIEDHLLKKKFVYFSPQVSYIGACFDERQTRRKLTPKFPGSEVAGIIHDVGNNLPNSNYMPGDRVIIVPDEATIGSGYSEYIPIEDPSNVIQVPQNVPLEVAAMLPGGALMAFAAASCARSHVERLQKVKCKYSKS